MANDFFRSPTIDERRDFTDIGPTRLKTPKQKFLIELGKQRQIAGKQKLPFFKKAAMDDFDEYFREKAKKSLRVHGYVDPSDFKPIQIDWSKYSSPENIKFTEVIDVRDAELSKRRPFNVIFKSYRYRYKGYGEEGESNMSVMEDEEFAIKRGTATFNNKSYTDISLAEKQSVKYGNKVETQGSRNLPGVPNDITEEEAKKADLEYTSVPVKTKGRKGK